MKTSVINKNSGDYGKFTNVQYSKDLAFATGRWQDLVRNGEVTSLTVNDATVDAGITLVANYEYISEWIANATSAIVLPELLKVLLLLFSKMQMVTKLTQ